MTIEQITAINNAMSMLSNISDAVGYFSSIEDWDKYIDPHVKALKISGVDSHIIEHFQSLCNSWLPVVHGSISDYDRYTDCYNY